MTLYTDNTVISYGGHTRVQDPLYAVQGHVIYAFASGIWASFDATYFAGGRTAINGAIANDLQQNSRVGATLALPLDRSNSIKLFATSGVAARTGNDFDAARGASPAGNIAGVAGSDERVPATRFGSSASIRNRPCTAIVEAWKIGPAIVAQAD